MTTVITNGEAFKRGKIDYLTYLKYERTKNIQNEDFESSPDESIGRLNLVIKLGPEDIEDDIDIKNIMSYMSENIGERVSDILDDEYNSDIITPNYILDFGINLNYGESFYYEVGYMVKKHTDEGDILVKEHVSDLDDKFLRGMNFGGSRRNKATPKSKAKPKHEDMTMKEIKEMCKANLIKLSKVVEGKRVVYKKKELITKLKRKKLL
jgi:hypothetical protein